MNRGIEDDSRPTLSNVHIACNLYPFCFISFLKYLHLDMSSFERGCHCNDTYFVCVFEQCNGSSTFSYYAIRTNLCASGICVEQKIM